MTTGRHAQYSWNARKTCLELLGLLSRIYTTQIKQQREKHKNHLLALVRKGDLLIMKCVVEIA